MWIDILILFVLFALFFLFVFDRLFEEAGAKLVNSLEDILSCKSILFIFAHPDDEIFVAGMLAKSSTRLDFSVTAISVTAGEGGFRPNNITCSEELRVIRKNELENHWKLLGFDVVHVMNYRDGYVFDNLDSLRTDIVKTIRVIKPDTLLTFDPKSGYTGHPDHCAVGQVVTESCFLAADPKYSLALGDPHKVEWLIYSAVPRGVMRFFGGARGKMVAANQDPPNYAMKIDKRIKIRGWKTHKSQSAYIKKVWKIPANLLYIFFDKEHYIVKKIF